MPLLIGFSVSKFSDSSKRDFVLTGNELCIYWDCFMALPSSMLFCVGKAIDRSTCFSPSHLMSYTKKLGSALLTNTKGRVLIKLTNDSGTKF